MCSDWIFKYLSLSNPIFIESIIVSKGGIQESLNISKSELVIPFDMISKIGDKIILKDIFNEDLAQMEEEIEDLKSKL